MPGRYRAITGPASPKLFADAGPMPGRLPFAHPASTGPILANGTGPVSVRYRPGMVYIACRHQPASNRHHAGISRLLPASCRYQAGISRHHAGMVPPSNRHGAAIKPAWCRLHLGALFILIYSNIER